MEENMKCIRTLLVIIIGFSLSLLLLSCGGSGSGSGSVSDTSGFVTIAVENGVADFEPDGILSVEFTGPMDEASITDQTFQVNDSSGNPVEGEITYNPDNYTASFTPSVPYEYNETYTIILTNGLQDAQGNHPSESITSSFTIKADNDPPAIETVSPAEDAIADKATDITVVFNEPVVPASVTLDSFSVTLSDGTVVDGEFAFSDGNRSVSLSPTNDLASETVTVNISGITDLNENICADTSWNFTTNWVEDTVAPLLDSFSPESDVVGVEVNKNIVLNFSEAIEPSTIDGSFIKLYAGENDVEGAFSFEDNNRRVIYNPTENLQWNTEYTIEITSLVKDLAGNSYEGGSWNFVTEGEPSPEAPYVLEFIPVSTTGVVPVNTVFTARFNKELNSGTVTTDSVKLIRESDNTEVDGVVTCMNRTIVFDPDANLEGGEGYTVQMRPGIEDQDGNAFSGLSWSVFITDTVNHDPLGVVSTNPADSAAGDWENPLHDIPLRVTFDRPVNPVTVIPANIRLLKEGSEAVFGTVEVISLNEIRFTPQDDLERETSYTFQVTDGVTDMCGNSVEGSLHTADFTTLEKLKVVNHYYEDGSYNKNYTTYAQAYEDTHTDSDVEIHSYIVVEFNLPVDASTISDKILVKRNSRGTWEIADSAENNYNVIGKISNDFPDASLRGQYIGQAHADPENPYKVIFKHHMVMYASPGGIFDWKNPNWNGIKPNYTYDVEVMDGLKDQKGGFIKTEGADNERSWSFTTVDVDYGLYWFKDGYHALKYVPGRAMPLDYYDPMKPVLLHFHGWQKNSTGYDGSDFRDYRRESFLWGGTDGGDWDSHMEATIDTLDPWKNGADTAAYPNGGGKDWNVGQFFWTQFADNEDQGGELSDDEGESKPRRAQTPIWSMYGPSSRSDRRAEYAVNVLSGGSYNMTRVATNSPNRALATIFTDVLQSALGTRPAGYDEEFRISAHSLGNQLAHGVLMVLKTRHQQGVVTDTVMPTRFFIIDPYWVDFRYPNGDDGFWYHNDYDDWGGVVPIDQGYWGRNESPVKPLVDAGVITGNAPPGEVCTSIIQDVLSYYETTGIKGRNYLPFEIYDVSRTTDGQVGMSFGWFGNVYVYNGDKNQAIREEAAMVYSHYEWIGGASSATDWGKQHVNGRLQVYYQYGFPVPTGGLSPRSSDFEVKQSMNRYLSDTAKGRFAYSSGTYTSDWSDDTFQWTTSIEDLDGSGGFPDADTGAWQR